MDGGAGASVPPPKPPLLSIPLPDDQRYLRRGVSRGGGENVEKPLSALIESGIVCHGEIPRAQRRAATVRTHQLR